MKKFVSIIIPFYDNLLLLKRAIKSIRNQTYKYYEIIIINDNPKKFHSNQIERLKKSFNFNKIKIINNKKNFGAGFSRNFGIKIAKGKYIAFLDSDDTWKKNKLSTQIKIMEKYNYLASHTGYSIIKMNQNYNSKRQAKTLNYFDLLKSCDIGLSTVVLKKSVLKNRKLFPKLKTKEDYVLWLRLSKLGVIFHGINKNLVNWNDTPKSLSKSVLQKIYDSMRVYYYYEKFNLFKSFMKTVVLSINYLKK